jgi:hypothetical protein
VRMEGKLWWERRDLVGGVEFLCVAEASALRLLVSLFAVSGAPVASPVDRGRARGAGHRIGPRRRERVDAAGNENVPQIPCRDALGTRLEML